MQEILSQESAGRILGLPLLADDGRRYVIVGRGQHVGRQDNTVRYRSDLGPDDVIRRGRVLLTSELRTVCDLARRLPLAEGVVVADDALRRGLFTLTALREVAAGKSGKGSARLRQVASLAVTNADSPPESLLRVALILAGLGPVRLQATVGGYPHPYDLLLEWARLLIEIDGWEFHGNRGVWIADRYNGNRAHLAGHALLRLGWEDIWPDSSIALGKVQHAIAAQPGRRCRRWAARLAEGTASGGSVVALRR